MHRVLSRWWEPHVVLRDWIRRATDAIDYPVKIADEAALRNSLSNLKVSAFVVYVRCRKMYTHSNANYIFSPIKNFFDHFRF